MCERQFLGSGDEGVKFLRAHFWLYATVHEGGFTIEEDREGLKPIMEFFLRERRGPKNCFGR